MTSIKIIIKDNQRLLIEKLLLINFNFFNAILDIGSDDEEISQFVSLSTLLITL
jgi:hypothetical protein